MPCPHGFEKPTMCVDCMLDGPVAEQPTWRRVGDPFAARHESQCRGCLGPIQEGEPIQRWDLGDDRTLYTHASCLPVYV